MGAMGVAARAAVSDESSVTGIPSLRWLTNSYLFIDVLEGICRAGKLRRSKAGWAVGGVLLFI